jgi:hypothetical protein
MCGRTKAEGGLDKARIDLANSRNGIGFIMAIVDDPDRRDVACFDIPVAFLHMDSEKDITMILRGRLAELMVQVAPNLYRKYITVDRKGMAILYIKMQKAVYRLLRSAIFLSRSKI